MYLLELAGECDPFAVREAGTAAANVRRVAPGVALADALDRAGVERLAYTRRATRVAGRGAATIAAAERIAESAPIGERNGTLAVRATTARGIDAPTRETERAVGARLVERGFTVELEEPDHVFRVVFTEEVAFAGWQVAASVRGYGARAPTDRPFFQPGSMDPLDARACANLAGAGENRLVVDPMCGTGGTLIEAGLAGSRIVGIDRQRKMVRGTRENLRAYVGRGTVLRGDATRLPLRADAADGVVFDAPYGRQSKIAGHDLRSLVAGALREAARIAPRGVVVADRSWADAARAAGWRVERVFERPVHRSLTRHVHLLARDEG